MEGNEREKGKGLSCRGEVWKKKNWGKRIEGRGKVEEREGGRERKGGKEMMARGMGMGKKGGNYKGGR